MRRGHCCCAGGTVAIRGHFTVTDNASGAVALSDDSRYDKDQVTEATNASDLATAAALATHDSDIKAGVNATQINSSATAAARLALSALALVPGTVNDANTAPTSTSFAASDITEATADHYVGRLLVFLTGALAQQASTITSYVLISGEGVFTVNELTEAPADGDTFIVL